MTKKNSLKISLVILSFVFSIMTASNFLHGNQVFAAVPSSPQTLNSSESINTEGSPAKTGKEHSSEPDKSVLGMFGINWKLFFGQLVNFGIILFVMWKFVFPKVVKGLGERTAKIEKSLADAEAINKERVNFDSWKKTQMAEARKEAASIIEKAGSDGKVLQTQMLSETKSKQEDMIAEAEAILQKKKHAIITEAKQELAEVIKLSVEKLIGKKLESSQDAELIKTAIKDAEKHL